MEPHREAVITGYGVVSPIGIGWAEFQRAALAGTSGIGPLTAFDARHLPTRIAGEVSKFDAKEFITPRKSLKVMSRDIQLGVAAARLAMEHAGLREGILDPDRLGVVFGADMIYCDVQEASAAFRACMVDGLFDFSRWGQCAVSELNPLWMLEYLPNMPACHIAIAFDARGPSNSIVSGEVSSLVALTEAARLIERGNADVVLTGGTSARIHPSVISLRSDEHYSHRNETPAEACRPFDRERDGQVPGEGAAAILLESRQHALARGARVWARVLGHGNAYEPCVKHGRTTGKALKLACLQALREGLGRGGRVGHVNAHGLGTIPHDPIEAQAIHDLLGDVPVTAPKSYIGNLAAASGAVELGFSLVALEEGLLPPTLNFTTPDPGCPVNVVRGEPAPTGDRSALLINQNLWGQATAVVVAAEA